VEDSQDTEVKPLIKHLKKYVLRSKIKIRDVSEEYDSWSVVNTQEPSDWSPSSSWKLGSGGAGEITWNTNGEEAIKQLRMSEQEVGSWDLRAGFGPGSMGRRLLVRRGDLR
jgi:folate-binding Fe-S cluster repair protein YgfZ